MPELTRAEVQDLQEDLNWFRKTYDLDVPIVDVDGDFGPATKRAIRRAKYLLGMAEGKIDAVPRKYFLWRLRHPKYIRDGKNRSKDRALVERGDRRRKANRRRRMREWLKALVTPGVTRFDGVAVARWMKPYLEWARKEGWDGRLTSGWRDPRRSEQLCIEICGRPSCPGVCAGRSSNHSGSSRPQGAVDVSKPEQFGELMERCPFEPKIFNALGARDPWHYSATGR